MNGCDSDGGGGDGSGDDDEISSLHFSDNYLAASDGEHSSDDDALNSQGSCVNDEAGSMEGHKHYEGAYYFEKAYSSLEHSDGRLYESDNTVNDTNV